MGPAGVGARHLPAGSGSEAIGSVSRRSNRRKSSSRCPTLRHEGRPPPHRRRSHPSRPHDPSRRRLHRHGQHHSVRSPRPDQHRSRGHVPRRRLHRNSQLRGSRRKRRSSSRKRRSAQRARLASDRRRASDRNHVSGPTLPSTPSLQNRLYRRGRAPPLLNGDHHLVSLASRRLSRRAPVALLLLLRLLLLLLARARPPSRALPSVAPGPSRACASACARETQWRPPRP